MISKYWLHKVRRCHPTAENCAVLKDVKVKLVHSTAVNDTVAQSAALFPDVRRACKVGVYAFVMEVDRGVRNLIVPGLRKVMDAVKCTVVDDLALFPGVRKKLT